MSLIRGLIEFVFFGLLAAALLGFLSWWWFLSVFLVRTGATIAYTILFDRGILTMTKDDLREVLAGVAAILAITCALAFIFPGSGRLLYEISAWMIMP